MWKRGSSQQSSMKSWDNEARNFEIDADLYTHLMILNIIDTNTLAFKEGKNVKDGLYNLIIEVDKLEGMLHADGTLEETDSVYDKVVQDFQDKLKSQYPSMDPVIFQAKVANRRFQYLYQQIMSSGKKKADLTVE